LESTWCQDAKSLVTCHSTCFFGLWSIQSRIVWGFLCFRLKIIQQFSDRSYIIFFTEPVHHFARSSIWLRRLRMRLWLHRKGSFLQSFHR
jgi:hypothetical protein